MDEMVQAVKHALQQCCLQVRGENTQSPRNALFMAELFLSRLDIEPAVRGLQLKVKITKQQAAKEQKLRRKNLIKYVPNAAAAVFKVLQTMSETAAVRCYPCTVPYFMRRMSSMCPLIPQMYQLNINKKGGRTFPKERQSGSMMLP